MGYLNYSQFFANFLLINKSPNIDEAHPLCGHFPDIRVYSNVLRFGDRKLGLDSNSEGFLIWSSSSWSCLSFQLLPSTSQDKLTLLAIFSLTPWLVQLLQPCYCSYTPRYFLNYIQLSRSNPNLNPLPLLVLLHVWSFLC